MTDFLLEIFSEEIPAAMQKAAAQNFLTIGREVLEKNGLQLQGSNLESFITPKRLVLYCSNLKLSQKIAATNKRGPKITANDKAVNGFLRSVGLKDKAQLQEIDGNYVFKQPESEIETEEIIENSLGQILQKMTNSWPKLMVWNLENSQKQAKWIRPVRNIAAILGNKIINFEFFSIQANNITFSKNNDAITLKDAADYKATLDKNLIMLDHNQRKNSIIKQVQDLAQKYAINVIDNEKSALFDEVAGLCQYPTALIAEIDHKFLELPEEILILTLKLNQKYFCLRKKDGTISRRFIFITDAIINDDNRQKIIKDNEKLVRARLNDAEFFIEEDLQKPLISRFDDLKKIVFHQKLGSVYDKSQRLSILSRFLSIFIPHCDLSLVEQASNLCKVDLTTKSVGELPELQGKIGSFYAQKQGQDPKIVSAIYEHYLPLGPNSELPQTPLGISLAIADKIDSITGFFLAGDKPTSSKDPYGLRRAVLGIIRIGFCYNIAFPIRILVEKSINAYPTKLLNILLKKDEKKFLKNKKILIEEIIIFFVERLKSYLKDNENLEVEVINVVIAEYLSDLDRHKYCDILYLSKKIKFLSNFIKNKDKQNIIELYKRSSNILAIAQKKDNKQYCGKVSRLALKNKFEKTLNNQIKKVKTPFKKLIIKGEFEEAFDLLKILESPLSDFFDNVMVNDSDKNLRENRLLLLAKIRDLFNEVADLSQITN